MYLTITELVIRHKLTGTIWFRCLLHNDQDNYIYISDSEENLPDEEEFNDNFTGNRNVRYMEETENFTCEIEESITALTVKELCLKAGLLQ